MAINRGIAPAVRPFGKIELNVPAPVTLPNGIEMWVVNRGEDEVSRLDFYLTGGTFQEEKIMQATTCAMSVLNGSESMDFKTIAEKIDFYGAWRQLQVYDNCTAIGLSSLNKNFDKTLPILFGCITHPTFPSNEFRHNQRQLSVNCATARERVKYIATKEMMRLYYGARHPLACDPTPQDIESLTIDDARDFYRRYSGARNCRLVLSGHITDRELRVVSDVVGTWDAGGESDPYLEPEPCPQPVMFKIVDKPGAVQAAVAMTIKAIPRRHPDYIKLRVLVTALGGYFGSRLMTNIREDKGYTYGISASLSGRKFDGYIGISTECDTCYTHRVIEEVKHEILELRSKPMSDQELEMVKNHMLSDLVKTLDTPFSIAGYVGNMFCYGIYPTYFNEQVEEIRHVTSQQLLDIAVKYLDPEQLRTVVVCDSRVLEKN